MSTQKEHCPQGVDQFNTNRIATRSTRQSFKDLMVFGMFIIALLILIIKLIG